MSTTSKISRRVRRIVRSGFDLPGDPFAGTKVDYAFNLVAAGVLRPGKHSLGDRAIIAALLGATGKRALTDARANRELRALVTRSRGRRRLLRPATQPTGDNLERLAWMLQLDAPSLRVLEFARACCDADMRELLNPISCPTRSALITVVSAATGQAADQVEAALATRGPLQKSGLLTIRNREAIPDRLELDHRLSDLLTAEPLGRPTVMERFLPAAAPPTLTHEDFAHLRQELSIARPLLAAALAQGRPGTNILLVGPTGAGKSELARLLAHDLAVPLLVAGREDREGEPPTAQDRLRSLLLGNRLLGSASRTLLVFDQMEDLHAPDGRRCLPTRLFKPWFDNLLQTNAVPALWTCQDVDGIDADSLRRFTFTIELGASSAGQRRRAWRKYLQDASLPPDEIERLVTRFEVSPAQIKNAVSAARLAAGGEPVTRALLEGVLAPSERIICGRRLRAPLSGNEPYLPEVLNTPVDLEALTENLVRQERSRGDTDRGVSLCLHGPPGTGKSAFVAHLARRLDRPLLVRRPSDLLGPYVGETEQKIAAAFEQAHQDQAVLLLDEADTFLRDRQQAQRSWEVSQVNELLMQLESFAGIVACTTNLFHELDQASLRRFSFKIAFHYLRPDQAERLFRATVPGPAAGALDGETDAAAAEVRALDRLTPGDFSAVARRLAALGQVCAPGRLLQELREELRCKQGPVGRIGFSG